jgi:hypothetical protein
VKIAVENPIDERCLEHASDRQLEQAVAVELRTVGVGRHVVGNPGHVFHREHAVSDETADRAGERAVVDPGVLERGPELDEIECLETQIELLEHELGKQLDEAGELGCTRARMEPLGGRCGPEQRDRSLRGRRRDLPAGGGERPDRVEPQSRPGERERIRLELTPDGGQRTLPPSRGARQAGHDRTLGDAMKRLSEPNADQGSAAGSSSGLRWSESGPALALQALVDALLALSLQSGHEIPFAGPLGVIA